MQMGMKAKAKGEIDGKQWARPSPLLHRLAYKTRASGANLSRYMKQDAGDRGRPTTYTSFPSESVSNVAASTSVQKPKGGNFSTRPAESLPSAPKSAKRIFESVVFWVDSEIISGLFVGLDEP